MKIVDRYHPRVLFNIAWTRAGSKCNSSAPRPDPVNTDRVAVEVEKAMIYAEKLQILY